MSQKDDTGFPSPHLHSLVMYVRVSKCGSASLVNAIKELGKANGFAVNALATVVRQPLHPKNLRHLEAWQQVKVTCTSKDSSACRLVCIDPEWSLI